MRTLWTILGWILRRLFQLYVERIVCLHFCQFKEAGSDLIYTHVHILGDNPTHATGVGHDDHTNPGDPKHNTVSGPDGCTFKKKSEILGESPQTGASATIDGSNLGATTLTTAYFHECRDGAPCPRGFTRIRCRCGWVCYTLDHDVFQGWYDERMWDNRAGEYRYPFVNARGTVPPKIACGKSIVLYAYTIEKVTSCTDYGGPGANNNPLFNKLETELRAAAARIVCDGACPASQRELWRGWKCQSVGQGMFRAEAAMQWEFKCG